MITGKAGSKAPLSRGNVPAATGKAATAAQPVVKKNKIGARGDGVQARRSINSYLAIIFGELKVQQKSIASEGVR